MSDPACPRPFPGHRLCFCCGAPIQECMGFTFGRDLVAHQAGKIHGALVREACWRCADRGAVYVQGFYPGVGLDWIKGLPDDSDS